MVIILFLFFGCLLKNIVVYVLFLFMSSHNTRISYLSLHCVFNPPFLHTWILTGIQDTRNQPEQTET
ncbi:hypothetical protein XELAEV_18033204mg [Xenopus laevis]|uniref:Uncharacterized protein n=1 Tax=Xenopus laevis TaxID=8355 RepID=A0A974CL76_XENLA|nr:hypothetical protein XELAEV_18033204mg [Xenopus laevis]